MVNFESVSQFFLSNPASLAGVIIALACLSIALIPIFAIVRKPSTFPGWAIFSVNIRRLPVAHALTTAKIMLIHLGVYASKFLPAPITIEKTTSPTQQDALAFLTTSNFIHLFQAVRFDCKFPAADWAGKSWRSCMEFAISLLAGIRTKPKAGGIAPHLIGFAHNLFVALETMKSKHIDIISYSVTSLRMNAIQRWVDLTQGTPELIGIPALVESYRND